MRKKFFVATMAFFLNSFAMEYVEYYDQPHLKNLPYEIIDNFLFPKPENLDPSLITLIRTFGFLHRTKEVQNDQKSKYKDVMDNYILPLCTMSLVSRVLNARYSPKILPSITNFSYTDLVKYTGDSEGKLPSLVNEQLLIESGAILYSNYAMMSQASRIDFFCDIKILNTMDNINKVSYGFETEKCENFVVLKFSFWFKRQKRSDDNILYLCVKNAYESQNFCILFDFLSKNLLNKDINEQKIQHYQHLYNYAKEQTIHNDGESKIKTQLTEYGSRINDPKALNFSIVIGKEKEANLPLDLIIRPLMTGRFVDYENKKVTN